MKSSSAEFRISRELEFTMLSIFSLNQMIYSWKNDFKIDELSSDKINQEFFDFLFKSDDLLLKEWFQHIWIEFW